MYLKNTKIISIIIWFVKVKQSNFRTIINLKLWCSSSVLKNLTKDSIFYTSNSKK